MDKQEGDGGYVYIPWSYRVLALIEVQDDE